jgi:uncharacterized protein YbjT (DUF2867 family)
VILVTGATGYVGRRLVAALSRPRGRPSGASPATWSLSERVAPGTEVVADDVLDA